MLILKIMRPTQGVLVCDIPDVFNIVSPDMGGSVFNSVIERTKMEDANNAVMESADSTVHSYRAEATPSALVLLKNRVIWLYPGDSYYISTTRGHTVHSGKFK